MGNCGDVWKWDSLHNVRQMAVVFDCLLKN